jgi:hypothetical protein
VRGERRADAEGPAAGDAPAAGRGQFASTEHGKDEASATSAPVALTESGLPVARSEVARILCDATVARIVVDAHDVPLNVGRDQRLYSGAQRRAVIVRDRQCAWPGCGILARWAEVHHIRWWARDHGETSVDNGVLLCEHHHHLVHQQDLVIQRHTPPERKRPRSRGGDPGDVPPDGPGAMSAPGVRYTFRTRSGRLVAPAADPPRTSTALPARQVPIPPVTPTSDRPTPVGPAHAGPATRSAVGGEARPAVRRRPMQPSFLDELIAAQPPDPPF